MSTQEEYNQWAVSMAERYLKHPYESIKETFNDIEYLEFEIKHPSDEEKNLKISTYGRELTLCFWKSHSHHDSFEDEDHEKAFQDLCNYIEDIMKDKVFFSASYKDDRLCSTGSSYNLENRIEDKYQRIEIKTWSGEHDQIITNG